jgi:hypothetical protein
MNANESKTKGDLFEMTKGEYVKLLVQQSMKVVALAGAAAESKRALKRAQSVEHRAKVSFNGAIANLQRMLDERSADLATARARFTTDSDRLNFDILHHEEIEISWAMLRVVESAACVIEVGE